MSIADLVVGNFAMGVVSGSFDSDDTTINLSTSHGNRFPSTFPYRVTIYNSTDFTSATDAYWAGEAEIFEVSSRTSSSLTGITRAREGTTAISSTGGKSYKVILAATAQLIGSFAPCYNVKSNQYGATGDGTTDDTTAIQAAITSAATTGGIVYIPPGTYKVSTTLTISSAGVTVRGTGKNSILKASSATFHVFTLSGAVSGIEIRDLQIQGAASTDGTGQYGVYTDSGSSVPTDVIIDKVFFSGPSSSVGLNNGIKIHTNGDNWKVSNCLFERLIGAISGTGYGILLGGGNRCNIYANRFIGTTGKGRHPVYLSAGARYNSVRANIIDGFGEAGISCHAISSMSETSDNLISENSIYGCCTIGSAESASIQIIGRCHRNSVIGNKIFYSGANGISISDNGESVSPSRNAIKGNYIYYTDEHGILLKGSIKSVVDSNDIIESSISTAYSYSGISCFSYPSGVTSDKNILVDNTISGTNENYGIHINGTSPVQTDIIVAGNKINIGYMGYIGLDTEVTTAHILNNYTPSNRISIAGAAAPGTGTWAVGDIVWNNAPAAAGNIGWVCTTAGTPGTWKTFGTIQS